MIKNTFILDTIHVGPGRAWANICWMFSVVVIFIITFLLCANFSRREKAVGFLVAEPQIIRINAPRSGRAQKIVISEGQKVRKGDVLFVIDPDPVFINGKPAAQAEIANIATAEEELNRRTQAITAQSEAKKRELTARIAAITKQISTIREGIELQNRTVYLVEQQLKTGEKLASSGILNITEIQRRETNLQDTRLSVKNLTYTLWQNEALLAELKGQMEQIPIEVELKLSEFSQNAVELKQRKADAEGRLALQISAPTDGTVDTLLTAEGQTVEAGSVIVSLLPETSVLRAELYVPSKAIVFISPNQSVRIAYDAFPYARYGFAEGYTESVAKTVLRPDEVRKPVIPDGPSFRVTVVLKQQVMKSDGKDVPLRPGLTLTADIILDRQSLAQWIIRSVNELRTRI